MADVCKSRFVRGTTVLIEVQDDQGVWSKVAAQRGGTLNRTADTLDTTNKEGYGWADNEQGQKSWSVDCDGLFVEDNDGFKALNAAWVNGDCVRIRVRFPSGLSYVGQAILTDFPIDLPYDDAVTYSLTFNGKGALEEVQGAPTIMPQSINVTGTAVTAGVTVGGTGNLTVAFTPSDTTDKTVTYTSLTPSLATVDQTGKVTGVAVGTASINVRSTVNTAISKTVDITVKGA